MEIQSPTVRIDAHQVSVITGSLPETLNQATSILSTFFYLMEKRR